MAWNDLELRDPATGSVLPESEIWKQGVLLSSAELQWNDVQLEQRLIQPIEWPEFAFDCFTVCLMMHETPLMTHQFHGGRWHTVRVDPGDVYVYSKGLPMRVSWDAPAPHMSIAINPAVIERYAGEQGTINTELMQCGYAQDRVLFHLAMALKEEARNSGPNGKLFVECVTSALVTHLLAKYAVFPSASSVSKGYSRGLSKADLARVIHYLQDNLCDDVSIEALASVIPISPYHFCRAFKHSMGISPHQYVIRERLERAVSLLRRGMRVSHAAAAVGFCDAAHLSRHMKRLMRITPSQVRNTSASPEISE